AGHGPALATLPGGDDFDFVVTRKPRRLARAAGHEVAVERGGHAGLDKTKLGHELSQGKSAGHRRRAVDENSKLHEGYLGLPRCCQIFAMASLRMQARQATAVDAN